MISCSHCGFENNNYFFCAGCGKTLTVRKKNVFSRLPESSTRFLEEVVNTIEKVFYVDNSIHTTLDMNTQIINMSEISKESGIFIIDDSQWKDVEGKIKLSCFFGETALAYILSFILSVIGIFLGSAGFEMTFKLFFTCYILVSFLQWFIVPYLTGSTVVAFAGHRCGLFVDRKSSVRGRPGLLLMLSLFMSLHSLIPFFLIEYLLAAKIKSYVPVALKITGIDYLKHVGGDK
jgi:hypothetical protein